MKVIDTFVLYKIIRRLSTPFKDWDMYAAGVIDEEGNFIVPKEDRTEQQLASYSYFDVLILNLKKALAKIPGGSTRIATFAAALYLIREGDNADPIRFESGFDQLVADSQQLLSEEGEGPAVPANNTANVEKNPKLIKFKNYKGNKDDQVIPRTAD
jgi:hypothetical protein